MNVERVHVLHYDFETRSTCNLLAAGAWRYAADPSTEVLCCAYAVDDEPVQLWVPGDPIPPEFVEAAGKLQLADRLAQQSVRIRDRDLCAATAFRLAASPARAPPLFDGSRACECLARLARGRRGGSRVTAPQGGGRASPHDADGQAAKGRRLDRRSGTARVPPPILRCGRRSRAGPVPRAAATVSRRASAVDARRWE